MRWNDTITLLAAPNKYQDEAGAFHEGERVGREIFCNPVTLGLVQMAQLRSSDVRMNSSTSQLDVGLRNEHAIQVRSIDYQNEDQVIYHGEEYEVLYYSGGGEFKLITIGQRLGSSKVEVESDGG